MARHVSIVDLSDWGCKYRRKEERKQAELDEESFREGHFLSCLEQETFHKETGVQVVMTVTSLPGLENFHRYI